MYVHVCYTYYVITSESSNAYFSYYTIISAMLLCLDSHEKTIFLSFPPEHLVCIVQVLGSHSIGAAELKLLIGALRPLEGWELPTYYFRLQRALSIMASEIGRDGTVPLYYFDLRKDESVSQSRMSVYFG